MSTMQINIVSQEKTLFSGAVYSVTATGIEGELGILYGHTPLLTILAPGQIRLKLESGAEEYFWVSGGILEVQPNQIIVLADSAERATDLDEAAVKSAKRHAEESLKNYKTNFDHSRAVAELAEITSQLRLIERMRET